MGDTKMPEGAARRICQQAIAEGRCGEMLGVLFDGGGVTLDSITGRIVLISAEEIAMLAGGEGESGG